MVIKKLIRSPRILEKRNELICQAYADGFFIEEVADMFRLQKTIVGKIIKVGKDKLNK